MALVHLVISSIMIVLAAANSFRNDPIREHPHSVVVTEGQWANFSCGIKLPGSLKWRIGDLSRDGNVYNSAGNLPLVEGVTAERSFPSEITRNIMTETIGVLATAEMDRVPIQCGYIHGNKPLKDSFSKFAMMQVERLNSSSSGSGDVQQ